MLALAIISTVILSIIIFALFGATVADAIDESASFTFTLLLGFVIMTIWILYAR